MSNDVKKEQPTKNIHTGVQLGMTAYQLQYQIAYMLDYSVHVIDSKYL